MCSYPVDYRESDTTHLKDPLKRLFIHKVDLFLHPTSNSIESQKQLMSTKQKLKAGKYA